MMRNKRECSKVFPSVRERALLMLCHAQISLVVEHRDDSTWIAHQGRDILTINMLDCEQFENDMIVLDSVWSIPLAILWI